MEKMMWVQPQMHEVQFEANEYVSVCVSVPASAVSNGPNVGGAVISALSGAKFHYNDGDVDGLSYGELPKNYNNKDGLSGDKDYNSGTVYTLQQVTDAIGPLTGTNYNQDIYEAMPKYLFVSKDGSQRFLLNSLNNTTDGTWS